MKGFIGLWRENDEEKHWNTIGIGVKDFERYEDNFVNRLVDEGLLSKERVKLFYNNTNRRQG